MRGGVGLFGYKYEDSYVGDSRWRKETERERVSRWEGVVGAATPRRTTVGRCPYLGLLYNITVLYAFLEEEPLGGSMAAVDWCRPTRW